jgi:FkbM family methyltransferase
MLPTAVAGTLRAWWVRRLIAGFPPRVVEHTYGAGPLKVLLADPLSQGWYDHDWAELPEIEVLRATRLRAGARVFDLGAHQGIVALMLAREVGPSGQIVAVEANRHNAAVAVRNRDLNGMTQVEVIQAAVSNRNGPVIFNEGLDGQIDDGSGSHGRQSVEGLTLDGLAERFGLPDVVMIDIEGAECMALEGGARVLASGAAFAVEVHVGCGLEKLGGSVERLFSYFPAARFVLLGRRENDDRFVPIAKDDGVAQDRFFALALSKEMS